MATSSASNFPRNVQGKVARLYPSNDRVYFHVTGDQSPYGFTESDYNFLLTTSPSFQASYQLLLEAAKNNWTVHVVRSGSLESHTRINQRWHHYSVDYIYVDFQY
jgi:hypothetical protein